MNGHEIPEGTVTVLFTDLVDSTRLNQDLGDERAREVGREVEVLARERVEANRGVLIKEMGDGLMAAFASARRAVTASREIQTELRRRVRSGLEASVQMRIGLHTGEVISEEGDIHGESVIIAKRIEGLAPPGGILASETTYGVLGTARDELVDHGAAELKGIDNEWRLYLVPVDDAEAVGLADNEPTPYVGRVGERERLRTVLEAGASGRGAMVLVSGEAGMGKSRLVREAVAMAERLGMVAYTGNCVDMESPPPYQPHVDQLEQAARTLSPTQFRTALGENAPEVAKLMPSLRQRYDDIPPSPELSPEQERRYMLHGVGEFIERASANRPLVLVFEDLHWADESTLLLLRQLGPRLGQLPLVVLATYRPDEVAGDRPLAASLGPLVRDGGALEVRLRLLGRDEVTEVLRARAGDEPPAHLVDLVFDETQGNPFFVEEVYRHLRESGKLFDESGGWRDVFEIGETDVPQSVRLVIEHRLGALEPDHRRILAAAAVIGRTFSFRDLAATVDASDDDVFDALEAGEHAHLIEEAPTDREARYAFVHEQFRQTLLGDLSLPRRQRLHLRVADALAARDEPPAVELAHHLHQAGPESPAARTCAALIAAATSTIGALAFEDALRHLERADPLADPTQRVEVCALRARALRGGGHVDDALAVIDVELARTDDVDRSGLRLQRATLLNDQYRAADAISDLEELVELAVSTGRQQLEVDVRLALGRAHYILSLDQPEHAALARDAYEEAYAAASKVGDKRKMALALLPTSWFTDYWADYRDTAVAHVAEAERLAQELGDVDLVLDARAAKMHRTGLRHAADSAEQLLADLEARADPVRLNAHCFWMMWRYLAAARPADCVAMCDRGIELAELIGTAPVQYGGIKALGLCDLGRYDEVDAALAQEVTDDAHPFGQAMETFARAQYLTMVAAWRPAADALVDAYDRAAALQRVWMKGWTAASLRVVAAHLAQDAEFDVAPLLARADAEGDRRRGTAAGEVALIEGRPEDALAAVDDPRCR